MSFPFREQENEKQCLTTILFRTEIKELRTKDNQRPDRQNYARDRCHGIYKSPGHLVQVTFFILILPVDLEFI